MIQQYIIDPIMSNPVFQGGLSLVIISFLFYQLKNLPIRIYRLVLNLVTETITIREYDPLFSEALDLVTESIFFPKNPKHLRLAMHQNKIKTQIDISAFITKINKKYYLTSLGVDESRSSENGASEKRWIIKFVCLRGHRESLVEVLHQPNKFKNQFKIFSVHTYETPLLSVKRKRSSTTLCLPNGLYDDLLEKCKIFSRSEALFVKKGMPWRLGICLAGEPGTGKSSIIHCLASDLDRDVYHLDITDRSNEKDILRMFNSVPENSIIVLEDLDCLTKQKDREDIDISLSGLLNGIDGLFSPENGRILIITSNHINTLDPALVRPGRIDELLTLPAAVNKEDARQYLKKNGYVVPVEEVFRENISPASFMNNLRNYI